MIIAFQIILLIVILMGLMGVISDQDKSRRDNLTALSLSAVIAFVITIYKF